MPRLAANEATHDDGQEADELMRFHGGLLGEATGSGERCFRADAGTAWANPHEPRPDRR